jgi:hypothetical protein
MLCWTFEILETSQKLQWPFRQSIVWECLPKRLFTFNHQSSCQLLVPIIPLIDCTSMTKNNIFSLKPYMFTPVIFTESFWRTIQAWGYHGYLPKSKTSTAQNQTQLQGDNIWNYHAQLKKT